MNIYNNMMTEFKGHQQLKKAHLMAIDYLDQILDRQVFPSERALQDLSQFDEYLTEDGTNAEEVLSMLNTYGSPATVATMGGRYFGFVCGSSLPITLAVKSLSTVWDQAPAMNVLSPIGAKLETVVENWLKDLFNLPEDTTAGFVSGTSIANFCALAAARNHLLQKLGWNFNTKGFNGSPALRIICCRQAHSTVIKAITLLGFGTDNIEWVDVDDQGRIITDKIPQLDETCILILQAGNVNSGAFDDFENIMQKVHDTGCWVHIDGAFGLWVQASNQLKHLTKSIELADSWAMDGHKTLNTPYDSGIVLCKHKNALSTALHMNAGYIITSEERDGMFYTPEMSRRARIIELWSALKYLGKDGLNQLIDNMHHRTNQFAKEISQVNGFEVLNEIVFNQVLVRCESDEITIQTIEKIQELRECWVGASVWEGKRVIRVSICSWATSEEDISRSVRSFEQAFQSITK